MSSTDFAEPALKPLLSAHLKLASTPAQLAGARQLRHHVFCVEQGLFDGDDRDAIDATALTLVALAPDADGAVIGTVRIHHAGDHVWWGSRLAVARSARRQAAVGSGLIRLAVGAARALGAHRFLAHVQQQNVAMFEQLHWQVLEEVLLHGRPHSLMQAELNCYAAIADTEAGIFCTRETP